MSRRTSYRPPHPSILFEVIGTIFAAELLIGFAIFVCIQLKPETYL